MYVKKVLFTIITLLIVAIICTVGLVLTQILLKLMAIKLADNIGHIVAVPQNAFLMLCIAYFLCIFTGPCAALYLMFYAGFGTLYSKNYNSALFIQYLFYFLITSAFILGWSRSKLWSKTLTIKITFFWCGIGVLILLVLLQLQVY